MCNIQTILFICDENGVMITIYWSVTCLGPKKTDTPHKSPVDIKLYAFTIKILL